MPLLSGVFLSNLQLHRHIRLLQPAKERRNRFADLKVNWSMFDLNNYVVVELAIERMEYIVCSFRAVALRILPVEVMVVYKRAIKNDSTVGFERACNHIGGVRRRPAVGGRAGPAFGIRLDNKSAEVWNPPVDRVHFLAPPLDETRVQRIECIQPSNDLGTAQINCYGDPDTPFTEGVSDASELRQKIIFKKARIRIDIIDGATVDPNGSEQASVLADARQVGADLAILEKDGTPTVSTFDSTIEVVPLVHPA